MGYKEVSIYYITGTGNSYRAASWMGETVKKNSASAHIMHISEYRSKEQVKDSDKYMVGLVFPTHGFTAPWAIIRFACGLPRRKNTHAFVVPTRGATKIGRFCLPGGECSAAYLIAFILLLKGYSLRGIMGLDMPLNWMTLFPGMHPEKVEVILARGKERTAQFMDSILSGERRLFSIDSIIQLFFGLLILPISFAYLIMGRFFIAKLFFANDRCNGCGQCVENCPNDSLRMWGKNKPRPYWKLTCHSCMRCMGYCPQEAIEGSQSLAVIIAYVISIPTIAYFMNWLSNSWSPFRNIDNGATQWILEYFYALLAIILTYFIFSLLIRIPLFNKFFTYTTLTHLYRRYHEPGTKLKDIYVKSKH